MNRRTLLKSGAGIAGAASLTGIWWGTRDDLSVRVTNTARDRKEVTLTVRTPAAERVYRDAFEVPDDQTVERHDIAAPGEYEVAISAGGNAFERTFDLQFCHDPVVAVDIGVGNAIGMGSHCRRLW